MTAASVDERRTTIRYGPDVRSVRAFDVRTGSMSMTVWDHGATIVSVEAPDGTNLIQSRPVDADYASPDRGGFMGATIGRYANRIADARMAIDGIEHRLNANEGRQTLHGGAVGFDLRMWSAEAISEADRAGVRLRLRSPDGDQGFPGTVDVTATFWLTIDNDLRLEYEAVTDAPTVISLTNHAYWNLAGVGTIADHHLRVVADRYLSVDDDLLPRSIQPVEGSRYDFRTARLLGGEYGAEDDHRDFGYDTCFILGAGGVAAVLSHVPSGRTMTVATDQPGLQVYTANSLDPVHRGVALEAQALPNSPNRPDFPTAILRPGDLYRHVTTHTFTF